MAHEMGHAIEHKLFFGKHRPITKYFLTETTSYLFELLMADYIANYLNIPIVGKSLIVNRTTETMDHAWSMKIQRLFYDQGEYNPEAVTQEMNNHGRMVQGKNLTIENIARINKVYYSKLINSYLLALQIFTKILEDPLEGFRLYRKIETDPEDNLDDLLQKHGIDYTRDENSYASMYNASKELSLSLTKRV
jgi:oligoendopeptidase F